MFKTKNVSNKKNNSKKFGNAEVIFLIITTCVVSLIMGYVLGFKSETKINDKTLNEFVNVYDDLINNYYTDINKKELLSGAINGMLSTLDQYSKVINDEESENFYLNLNGSYDGVGIEIINDKDNNICVVGVLEDSPASLAGIKVGDIVKSIDDMNMTNESKKTLSTYIRKNNQKKEYTITIDRNGEELKFKLKKERVIIKSISSKIIEKNNKKIGYIYISIFSNTTANQYKKHLKELESKGIDSLIIDVRENTGGHLTTATSILSSMVSSDKVIYQTDKDNNVKKYYSLGTENKKYPIIVIQNKNSASASEMLAISLKENLNATIVGEKSCGKGTIQEVNYLSNGDSYKYTTKKWLSPKGNSINETGIIPDIEISLDDNYYNNPTEDNDNQLQTAINELVK